ncbi:hypothetical protein Back11_15140 [Paenibacillus baekrokdamisoli]|uniref:Uncharacterized protein n=1 Tax=Paenibacillus baekrokdamisoli TaxID=1712516 RepID=A0A3G9JAY8_9BACL|nr:hypothetical protein [Paenibacillus baekrokdamisoli]MBB3072779.1 hypothetical protein [Paenibacillus baekrokdamisoli]BBH20169.1 hypothetical protein Back11_15140 [Paenibacillus baekrokdamisoli]
MPHSVTITNLFNWNLPRFVPIKLEVLTDEVRLHAGGETVVLQGSLFNIDSDQEITPAWKIEEYDFSILFLELKATESAFLKKVTWFSGTWEAYDTRLVHATELQDNFLFLRKGNVSFFLSLDFPSSKISEKGIYYEPWDEVPVQTAYHCHTLTTGACMLSGHMVGDYDRAEIEAVSAYIEQRFPLRFNRPVNSTTCITNRMTDVREGRIFYSMYDNPTLLLSPEVLEQEIDLCAEVGIEYYQVFEGVFDWPEDDTKSGEALRKLVEYGAQRGVRVGDYVHPGELYCPHYNYEQRQLDRPEWRQLDAHGNRGQLCLGHKDYAEFLRDKLVAHNRKYNEQMICLDMLSIQPCYNTSHHHPEGDVYHQIRGLVDLLVALAGIHPEYLIWTNSGNWLEFMPKLVWYNPNIYLTDPHVREYTPNLNMLKLMGDTRREQMVTFHNTYMVPYRFYTNCEYYYSRRSRIHDLHVFEYSLLQGLAVTPNICLGEWRTFLERIPSSKRDECVAFMKKWLGFIKENFDLWQHTKQVGDSPSIGAMEAYSHMDKDHGFICLVNQNPFPGSVTFQLNGTIGLEEGKQFDLFEIYPQECPLVEQSLPYAASEDSITCSIPPQSVRFIEIKPAAKPEQLKVFGLPAKVERTEQGYRLIMKKAQGEIAPLRLLLPDGEQIDRVTAQHAPTVRMFTFPVFTQLKGQIGNIASLDVTFPRIKAPRELTHWTLQPDNKEIVLPQQDNFPFLGALVSGAYSETTEVWLDIVLETGNRTDDQQEVIPDFPVLPAKSLNNLITNSRKHTFETVFELPFIEWDAFAQGYDDDALIELSFNNPTQVGKISATINEETVEVRRYFYATKKEWYSFYIVLTGKVKLGMIKLVVEIEWNA